MLNNWFTKSWSCKKEPISCKVKNKIEAFILKKDKSADMESGGKDNSWKRCSTVILIVNLW